MIEVLKQALEVIETAIKAGDWKVDGACDPDNVIHGLRQTIAEAEKQSHSMMNMPHDQMVAMAYGYPPQSKPLTDEQIEDLYFDGFSISKLKDFARAIEAAHGIKE